MPRFGLCCLFKEQPIKFRHVTAKTAIQRSTAARILYLSELCLHNSRTLLSAVQKVKTMQIGAFRIMSQLFPLYTHPEAGYVLTALPDCEQITGVLQEVNRYCRANDIRLSFHPDQFITIASPNPAVVVNSIKELEYHGFLAELIGADIVNIHIGGVFNDKNAVLKRFAENFKLLSPAVKTRLAVENDDISYSVQDVLPLCEQLSIPMVYDVHHHRCNPDKYSIAEATDRCIEHWMALRREPHFHISSPLDGWNSSTRRSHADYIDFKDVPEYWLKLNNFTLDVEAKAKELAVTKLIQEWNDTGRLSVDC